MMATEHDSAARSVAAPLLTVRAPAKLNLTLRVRGRRPDGYHELESLVIAIDLFDELALVRCAGSSLRLKCNSPDLPTDDRNLVVCAVRELARTMCSDRELDGLEVHLTKRIPVGAGLGGGSSDAAATLTAINELAALGLARGQLAECAARIGSDVPFFLHPPVAVIRGRGECVEPLAVRWAGCFLLIFPPIRCSSREVYARWKPTGDRPDRTVNPFAGSGGLKAAELGERLFNDLEGPAFEAYPQLSEWRRQLEHACRTVLRLSGSGSTLFSPFDTREGAEETAATVRRRFGFNTFIAQLLSDGTLRGASP